MLVKQYYRFVEENLRAQKSWITVYVLITYTLCHLVTIRVYIGVTRLDALKVVHLNKAKAKHVLT